MSELKHTPGPWSVAKARDGYFVHAGQRPGIDTIADVADWPVGGLEPERSQGNAFLIAAAPDLLAACKLAESAIGGDGEPAVSAAAMEVLDRAIAKAEGRS